MNKEINLKINQNQQKQQTLKELILNTEQNVNLSNYSISFKFK